MTNKIKIWEENDLIEPKKKLENSGILELNDIITEIKNPSVKNECVDIGNKKKWVRNCPQCNKECVYVRKEDVNAAIKLNSKCRSCSKRGISTWSKGKYLSEEHKRKISESNKKNFPVPIDGWFKHCPVCKKKQIFSKSRYLREAIKKNTLCYSCIRKGKNTGVNNYWFGKHFTHTEETKRKIAISSIGRKIPLESIKKSADKRRGRIQSEETRRKISLKNKGRICTSEQIHKKVLAQEKTKYQRKSYILPNGETVRVQGYEPWTLDKLFLEEHNSVNNIKIKMSDKPRVKYSWNGVNKWYYPDCYCLNTNTIVETKSDYTWETDLQRNLSKIKAARKEGFNIRLIIWNRKKQIISDVIYEKTF